jgi:hypothetical protein
VKVSGWQYHIYGIWTGILIPIKPWDCGVPGSKQIAPSLRSVKTVRDAARAPLTHCKNRIGIPGVAGNVPSRHLATHLVKQYGDPRTAVDTRFVAMQREGGPRSALTILLPSAAAAAVLVLLLLWMARRRFRTKI